MSRTQLLGFVLWRSGLLLVAGYSTLRIARFALQYMDLPAQINLGLGLTIGGAVLVMGSLVAERVVDARAEEGLAD